MTASVSQTRIHLNGLTGLRFWAAALVMFYHYTSYLGYVPVLSEATRFGNSGVTFFFVLSGFVLAWTYTSSSTPKRVFYWRRFARIWPLHILTTVISLVAWRMVDHPIGHAINVETLWPAFFLVHAWSWDQRVIQGGSGASWSLSDEAFFYAIFPFLLAALIGVRVRRVLVVIPVVCTLIAAVIWLAVPTDGIGPYYRSLFLSYFPLVRVTQFIAGVALGVLVQRGWAPVVTIRQGVGLVSLFMAAMLIWSEVVARGSFWYPHAPAQLFSIVPYGMLIVAVAQSDIAGKANIFAGKRMQMLGHASFALYLIHVPVALFWVAIIGEPGNLATTVLAWIIVAVLANVLAIVLYTRFEHPIERRLRRLVRPPDGNTSGSWRIAGDS